MLFSSYLVGKYKLVRPAIPQFHGRSQEFAILKYHHDCYDIKLVRRILLQLKQYNV